jgi:NADH dehydrogenase FAD-containing subunit
MRCRLTASLELISDRYGAGKEKVLILGSGWAGYAFARTLDPAKYERLVISPRSYFVFTPLLASTSVGTLELRVVLEPVRRLKDVRFYQGWADEIDFERKEVRVETNPGDDLSGTRTSLPPPVNPAGDVSSPPAQPQSVGVKGDMFDVSYDKLVIAVGAYSQTFGIEGVRQHAHFLRDIGDARKIRLRVLSLFEKCSYPNGNSRAATIAEGTATKPLTDEEKSELLHFAIVGGGPTGIEFAAELHDLIHDDLATIYPDLVPFVRITVYDVAPKVLPMVSEASGLRVLFTTLVSGTFPKGTEQ